MDESKDFPLRLCCTASVPARSLKPYPAATLFPKISPGEVEICKSSSASILLSIEGHFLPFPVGSVHRAFQMDLLLGTKYKSRREIVRLASQQQETEGAARP
eukprot:scaffold3187_cov34-Tisochrysis_lutea.AAC.4